MNELIDPEWHSEQLQSAETLWREVLTAIGSEKVRDALLESKGGESINLGFPFRTKNPTTGRPWEYHPSTSFVISWLAEHNSRMQSKSEAEAKRTLRIQYVALVISLLSTLAALASTIATIR